MKIATLFHEHPSLDLDLFFQLQGLKNILSEHSIYVGPIPSWEDPRSFRVALSHYDLVLFSGLDGAERKVFLEQAAPLGIPCIPFGSIPTAFCSFEKTPSHEARAVFIPDEFQDSDKLDRQQKLFGLLNKRMPTLWMGQTLKSFESAPWMGAGNFYAPKAPHLHLAALGAASCVISCRLAPAVLAAFQKIPTVLVSFSEEMTKVAQIFGLPVLVMGKKRSSAKLLSEVEAFLSQYPWTQVTQNLTAEVLLFKKDLEKVGLEIPSFSQMQSSAQKALPSNETALPLASVVNVRDLPAVEGWIANIENRTDTKIEFHLLITEKGLAEKLTERFKTSSFHFYELSDLWTPEELSLLQLQEPTRWGVLSKPKLLNAVLKKLRREVFYCDPHFFFYSSPSSLLKSFTFGEILLFPTWKDDLREARRSGLYESGLLGVRPGAEKFLTWWNAKALDQRVLDFVPLYFKRTCIYRQGDQAVAPWNIDTLAVEFNELVEFSPRLAGDKPVVSSHAPSEDRLGVFEAKTSWDQLISFLGPRPFGSSALLERIWISQGRYSYRLENILKIGANRFSLKLLLTTRLWNFIGRLEGLVRKVKERVGATPIEKHPNLWEENSQHTLSPWASLQRKAFLDCQEEETKSEVSLRIVG